MPIEGKVAKILNERELVINRGLDAGVTEDMKFKVMEPTTDIHDPETGEALGPLRREKIRINVIEVHPKFAIGRTFETYKEYVGAPSWTGLSTLTSREVTRVRTLRTDAVGRFDVKSSFIKQGDQVVEVQDDP